MKKIMLFIFLSFPLFGNEGGKIYYTVAGGAALGVYEGGFLYYVNQTMKKNLGDKIPSTHSTGASAGAFNSLLNLFSKCSLKGLQEPTESFFYKGWIPLGVDKLFSKKNVQADQIFSLTEGLDIIPLLKEEFLKGFKKDCKLILGISVTRFNPVPVKLNKYIDAPNMTEEAVIEVTGRGPGVAPELSNFEFKKIPYRQLLLPFSKDPEKNFDILRDLVYASTAYPVAFPPQKLYFCQKDADDPYFPCKGSKIGEAMFVDGGVFNNSPVALSYRIAQELGLQKEDRFVWVNPDSADFVENIKKAERRYDSFFGFGGDFFANFTSTARSRDLVTLSNLAPEISKTLLNTTTHLPPASGNLGAFLGFFEKDFRIFDFYLGMVDANDMVNKQKRRKILFPEEKDSPEWAPYYCIKGFLNQEIRAQKICQESKVDENFMILLQVAFNTLYNKCSKFKGRPKRISHCQLAFDKGEPPVVIDTQKDFSYWRALEDESNLNYFFRQLAYFKFEFKDFNLKKDDADRGKEELRFNLETITKTWVNKLPDTEQLVIGDSSSIFLNQEIYFLPKHPSTYLTLGTAFEVGRNFARIASTAPSYFKFAASVLFQGGYNFMGAEQDNWALSPLFNIEWVFPFSDYKWQYSLGLKVGYQFANNDEFGSKACNKGGPIYGCTGITTLPFLGVTFMELAKFQIMVDFLPEYKDLSLKKGIILQLGVEI